MEEGKKIKYVNGILFLLFGVFSFFAYRYVLDSGDALMYCVPHKAKNPLQFIWYSFSIWMKHNMSQGVVWAFPFALSQLFSSGSLFKMPWWLCIGALHFCLVASAVNVSFFFKKVLKLDVLTFILTICFFIGGYSLNASYLHYSFNIGNGMYPVAIYLFTIYLLQLVRKKDAYVIKLVLFLFMINLNDIVKIASLFFWVWGDYYSDRLKTDSLKSFGLICCKRLSVPVVLFALNVFLAFRAVNSSVIKNFANVVEFSFRSVIERVFLYFERLENICYESFLNAFSLSFLSDYTNTMQLFVFLVFFTSAAAVVFLWYKKKNEILRNNRVLIGLFTVGFLSLYCCNARAFIALKHGHYADDNFMFLFMFFAYVLFFAAFRLLKINKGRLPYYKALLIIFCLLFAILPNMVSAYDTALFYNNQGLRDRNYEMDFFKSIDNQTPDTIPVLSYKLSESKNKILLRPITMHWQATWQNKKYVNYVPGSAKDKNFRELYACSPAFIPFDFLFLDRKKPVLIRETFFRGEAVRDYYIPEELLDKDIDLTIFFNNNFAGSPATKSFYQYRLVFAHAAGDVMIRDNLIAKSKAYTFLKDPKITFLRYRGLSYRALLFILLDKYAIPYNIDRFSNTYVSDRDYLNIVWSIIDGEYLNDSYRKLENIIGNDYGDKLKDYLRQDSVFRKTFSVLATEIKRAGVKVILRVSVEGGTPEYSDYSSDIYWK